MKGTTAILGATSGIAKALALELLNQDQNVLLLGRDVSALARLAQDLAIRTGKSQPGFAPWSFDEHPREALARALAANGSDRSIDHFILASGLLIEEDELEAHPEKVDTLFSANVAGLVKAALVALTYFKSRGQGTLCVLSSVAGQRGRSKNASYGASKAALDVFLEGWRGRVVPLGVKVTCVRLGPVRTPMTAHYQGPAILLAEPEAVARIILKAMRRGQAVVYAPGYWRWVMAVLRRLPEFLIWRIKA